MSDITKCPGTGCPVKEKCYRFTAETGEQQSWFAEIPGHIEYVSLKPAMWKCEMYWGENQQQIMNTINNIVGGKS